MAKVEINANDVVVHLSRVEAVAACRREVRVPVRHLTMVHVEESPLAVVSLLRMPGLAWPGAFVFGSRRRDGRREFVVVRAGLAAVVLEAEGALWDRVVVSHPDAVDIAAELAALLLSRGPGKTGHGDHTNGDRTNGRREKRRRARQVGPSGLTLDRAGVSGRARVAAEAGVSA
jgi:hypothetical protein